jgi:bacteriorhodopsin
MDRTEMSFWIVSVALIASSFFIVLEKQNINNRWNTSLSVSSVVLFIAAVHYFYMKQIWSSRKIAPTSIRYIDWFLTVPLQIIEFYLILSIQKKIPKSLFYKLMAASVFMLLFGYLGELVIINRIYGFVIGTIFWLYILYELFFGEAAQIRDNTSDKGVVFAFDALKWIVFVGWSIYPVGYLLNNSNMNFVYNIGDFVNKILFCLIIWYASKYK